MRPEIEQRINLLNNRIETHTQTVANFRTRDLDLNERVNTAVIGVNMWADQLRGRVTQLQHELQGRLEVARGRVRDHLLNGEQRDILRAQEAHINEARVQVDRAMALEEGLEAFAGNADDIENYEIVSQQIEQRLALAESLLRQGDEAEAQRRTQ